MARETHPSLGPLHSDTLITVNNLAGLRFRQGKLDQAGELYERDSSIVLCVIVSTSKSTLNAAQLCKGNESENRILLSNLHSRQRLNKECI